MEIHNMYTFQTKLLRGLLLTVLIGLLTACGGGGSASTSVPVVAKGVITDLGSIWVNGVEYETPDGGLYSSDDESVKTTALEASALYKVGQVVSLRGRRNDDGVSGTADEVEYQAEIEGAADSTSTINGVTIFIDDNSTNLTLAPSIIGGALVINQRYEVSGFWMGDLIIQATFIKHDDDGDLIDEVKGQVDLVDSTSITVNGETYLFNDASDFFVEGNIVEIHFDPNTQIASRIELEDDLFNNPDDGLETEREGAADKRPASLSDANCPPEATFLLDGTCVDTESVPAEWMDGLASIDDLVTGSRVEVEGHFNADGVLIAEKIKGRGNRVRINATASNVVDGGSSAGTLDVFGGVTQPIQVTALDGLTEIDINGAINRTSFSSITNGDGLEIRGIRTGTTATGAPTVLALRIKDDSVGPTDHELRAEVDLDGAEGSDILTNNITVMGISSLVDANTKLKDEGIIIQPGDGNTTNTTPAQIDSNLDLIDDDNDPTNGARHIVQVRIDTTNRGANGGNGSSGTPYTTDQVEIEREDD